MVTKLLSMAAFVAALAAGAVHAQEYPTRLIKILQGFGAGGNVDIIARLLGHQLQGSLGQSVVVEAKPGAAGSLAAETIARSAPDGYTLLVLPSAHPMHGGLAKHVKYNVVDDFTWISTASFYPFLICVRKDSRFQTLKQLIDVAHADPGGLKYASSGPGTGLHTVVELVAHRTKSKFLHVPYRGEGQATTALLTGDVDFIAVTTGPISPRIRAGEFRALAVTSKSRWGLFPDVPTADEAGVPGFEFISWTGLAAPAHLPEPIVKRLNAEMHRIVAVPEVRERLIAMGGDPHASTPEEMKALIARQYELWKGLAKETGISIN